MPRSDISLVETKASNCETKTDNDEIKVLNKELSRSICLQLTNYSSIESGPSSNYSKTKSKVNFKVGDIQIPNSVPIISRVQNESQNSLIEDNVDRIDNSAEIKRSECEGTNLEDMKKEENMQLNKKRTLAIRSLETNLLLFGLVILMSVLYLVPSPTWQSFFTAANESLQKGLLPTLSTMANLGTIRSVALQYWKYSSNKIDPS